MPAHVGSLVVVRDERWRLARIDAGEQCSILTLDGRGATNAGARLRVIEPFDRAVAVAPGRIVRRKRRTVLRRALAAIDAARPAIGLWTAAGASIDLLAYQLEPALAVLGGATRLLLADAVGLGKTIQAALILAELRERGLAERALVLCPAGLRATWASELEQRFHMPCAVMDQAAVAERMATLPPGVNPWNSHATIVASIDFVKRPDVFAALEQIPIDVLIVDEAHHLTPGTDRAAAATRLASRAVWCVLASATPHSGDVAAFEFLTGLGAHRDALVIFKRTREDAGFPASRRERLLAVRPGKAEARLLAAIDEYARAIWRTRGTADRSAQLVAITIARRAASSTLALERTLTRRRSLLAGEPESAQPLLPWEDPDDADGTGERGVLSAPGLESVAEEHALITHLLTLVARCGAGAKLRRLGRMVARIAEPVIVFTEYRDTVDAILAMLPATRRAGAISGAHAIDERRATIDAFTRGGLDVLVATDAAGEGLNLHHRCRMVIDMELPWNPLRLEQRIGRVDRLGQRRRVHAIRLFHPGTIEQRVLDRLQLRQRLAGFAGGGLVTEVDVARAVFDGGGLPSSAEPCLDNARPTNGIVEAQRLAARRTRGTVTPWKDAAVWAEPRRARAGAAIALHSIGITNRRGAMLAEPVCACAVDVCWPAGKHRRRTLIKTTIVEAAGRHAGERHRHAAAAVDRELAPFRSAVGARITAIRASLAAAQPREHQPSLFDRREEAAAAQHELAAAHLDEALGRRLDDLQSPATADAAGARLVALWPVRSR